MDETKVDKKIEVVFTSEAADEACTVAVDGNATVGEFVQAAAKVIGREDLVDVFLEDADEPLGSEVILLGKLPKEFAPLHLAARGDIVVTIRYQADQLQRGFKPSATVAKVVTWAIGPEGFKLQGAPGDFQIKYNGQVEPADRHLGQIARGQKAITLELVFNLKPQG